MQVVDCSDPNHPRHEEMQNSEVRRIFNAIAAAIPDEFEELDAIAALGMALSVIINAIDDEERRMGMAVNVSCTLLKSAEKRTGHVARQ